jgi:hypothetical protein
VFSRTGSNASDGKFFLDLTGYHDSSPYGGVSQTVNLVGGNSYRLSLDLGTSQTISVSAGPISVLVTAGNVSQSFTYDPPTGNLVNIWQTFGLDFTANSNSTTVSIIGTMGNKYIGLDNVSMVPTPIPGAAWLLGTGLVGLVGLKRRFQR